MKLKINVLATQSLRSTLSAIMALRKFCVLRFTPTHLNIISAALHEPQVWCKLLSATFDAYEVELIRDNTILMEIAIDALHQVLRDYEKLASDCLMIRLQKVSSDKGHRSATLALFFTEPTLTTSLVSGTFRIPVRLLKRESDERITEPELSNIDMLMKLPMGISSLFKRVERYRRAERVVVTTTPDGRLGLAIQEDALKVTISWNALLEVSADGEGSSQNPSQVPLQRLSQVSLQHLSQVPLQHLSQVSLQHQASQRVPPLPAGSPVLVEVRVKDLRLGSRITEVCRNAVLIVLQGEAMVLHCYLDDVDECEIIYFIAGVRA